MANHTANCAQPAAKEDGFIARLRQFFADCRDRRAFLNEIADLERRGCLDTLLQDMGMSLADMEQLVRGYPEAGRLMPAMAERLGVDLEKLDPRLLYALRQNCGMCVAHRRCRQWLGSTSVHTGGAAAFCPNSELFESARKAQPKD